MVLAAMSNIFLWMYLKQVLLIPLEFISCHSALCLDYAYIQY